MAKKKTKVVSNRGYATMSAPKKPVAVAPVAEAPITETLTTTAEEVVQPETKSTLTEDPILKLVKKYESIHDRKAQVQLERMDVEQPIPEERVKRFRLTADLEKDLLQVIKHEESDVFGAFSRPLKSKSSENDKEKIIAQLDILYRTLAKLGFSIEDVSSSFEATVSKSIEDHLDWLCVHTPYERMPIGFFDKYFNEEDNEQLILLHNANNKATGSDPDNVEKEKEKLVLIEKKSFDEKKDMHENEVKARVLQAAQQYMEEEDEDINEKYAAAKVQLTELEKLLPSNANKKSKKKSKESPVIVLTDEELIKLNKDMKKLKDKLYSLEADWDFDKKKAEELYLERIRLISEEKRQKAVEEKSREKEPTETVEDVEVDNDDEEGGMFGGLLMEDESESTVVSTPTESAQWKIVDLKTSKSWMGKYPKNLVQDYCTRQNLGKQKFSASNVGAGIWRATLNIHKVENNIDALHFDLPENIGAENRHDAEQLVALYALFTLDSNSSVYKVLPPVYKDLWTAWLEEKTTREEAPRIEADKKRLSFLTDLVENSCNRSSKGKETSVTSSKDNSSKDAITGSTQKARDKNMFARVQSNFKSRLDKTEYITMKEKRQDLPIAAYRQEILDLVNNNQVLIISGETGCGKSTQVPQFLAEDILINCQSKEGGSVVCTQPRRISAMSIANRVSTEMGDKPRSTGSRDAMVGYQIRLESKMSAENVLLFCTTGILLRRLESDKLLEGVTHVVVDEVHERTIDSDFLLIVLKELCQVRKDLKIILMSATVEADRFSRYFGNCPVVSVPGRTYPVHVQYLEDVVEDIGYVLEEDSPFAVRKHKMKTEVGNVNVSGQGGSSKRVHYEMFEEDSDDDDPYDPTRIESKLAIIDTKEDLDPQIIEENKQYSRQTRKMIKRMDEKKINYDLILELLNHICQPRPDSTPDDDKKKLEIPDKGAILVFLPGMNEIRKLYDLVSGHSTFGDASKFLLIALHSTLSSEHQEKAFDIPPEGVRKIVFATNIAETGITISDVTIVIDTGMAKVVSYDDKKRVTRLLQKYIAKANARQRRGRAGRVQEGLCFHLFTQKKFEEMNKFETPEILRLPLEELCLRIKVCDLGSIRDVLGAALDSPTPKMIENAILTLQEVQALSLDESLTPLGSHLANLPVDVHIGKMILFGAIFKCLDPILTIAAALSFKSPFIRPFGKEDEADAARARFRIDNSDFLTIYRAYEVWREHYLSTVKTNPSKSSLMRIMRNFCKNNFLSQQNLETIEEMKRQYLDLLISIGFVKANPNPNKNRYDMKRTRIQLCDIPDNYNIYVDSIPVVNAALTAGLYPKIAEYLRQTNQVLNKNMELKIHPSSMLFGRKNMLLTDFLIYNTVVMNNNNNQSTDNVYMWETSSVDAVAIILLATDIEIKYKQRKMVLDNWIYFDCFARTAVLLKFLREQLNVWLSEKMNQPDLDLSKYNETVLEVLVKALESNNLC